MYLSSVLFKDKGEVTLRGLEYGPVLDCLNIPIRSGGQEMDPLLAVHGPVHLELIKITKHWSEIIQHFSSVVNGSANEVWYQYNLRVILYTFICSDSVPGPQGYRRNG